jgi:hypothetical protein
MNNLDIFEENPQRCEGCGFITQTLPYGLHHEEICVDCAMKDMPVSLIRMKEHMLGYDE